MMDNRLNVTRCNVVIPPGSSHIFPLAVADVSL